MIQTHAFTGATTFAAEGTMFVYRQCLTGSAEDQGIEVRADGRLLGELLPGDRFELPKSATSWGVMPNTAGLAGEVVIGSGRVGLARIRGPRELMRNGFEATLAGFEYLAGLKRQAIAGKYPSILLFPDPQLTVALTALQFVTDSAATVRIFLGEGTDPASWLDYMSFTRKKLGYGDAVHACLYAFDQAAFAVPVASNQTILPANYYEIDTNPNARASMILTTPIALVPQGGLAPCLLLVSSVAGGSLSVFADAEIPE